MRTRSARTASASSASETITGDLGAG
jgi:hypothetical protein